MEKKTNLLNKKKGRISKDNTLIKGNHNKYSDDNLVKKTKVLAMNFLIVMINSLIENILKKLNTPPNNNSFLQPIKVNYRENVTKEFNIHFLNQKIYIILSLNSYNIKVIKNYLSNKKFNEIMNMKLNVIIQTFFLMKSNEYIAEFSSENQFLFDNLKEKKTDKTIYEKMKEILKKKENSLLTYFEEIKGRKLKKNSFYKEYYQIIEKNQKAFEEYQIKEKNQKTFEEYQIKEKNQKTFEEEYQIKEKTQKIFEENQIKEKTQKTFEEYQIKEQNKKTFKENQIKEKNLFEEYQIKEKNHKAFEEYQLNQKQINTEMMKEFDKMNEKEEQKYLIKKLNLPFKEENILK